MVVEYCQVLFWSQELLFRKLAQNFLCNGGTFIRMCHCFKLVELHCFLHSAGVIFLLGRLLALTDVSLSY